MRTVAMSETYVDAARRGKNTWPRYLLGTLLILFFWLVIGNVLSGVLIFAFGGSIADLAEPSSLGRFRGYLVLSAAFLTFLGGIVLVVMLIHRRSLRTLVTPRGSIDGKRIAQGFGVWFALMCVVALVLFLLDRPSYWFGLDLAAFIPFALVALMLTPIQTTTEELFFRGYLVQGASLISRSSIFLVGVSGVLFTLPHLVNPEVSAGIVLAVLQYLTFGLFWAWISLKDGTTELAIGAHAANNLFLVLVLNYAGGALGDTPAIFHTNRLDPLVDLIAVLAVCAFFYLLVFVVPRKVTWLKGWLDRGAAP